MKRSVSSDIYALRSDRGNILYDIQTLGSKTKRRDAADIQNLEKVQTLGKMPTNKLRASLYCLCSKPCGFNCVKCDAKFVPVTANAGKQINVDF